MDTAAWIGFAGMCLGGYFAIMNPISITCFGLICFITYLCFISAERMVKFLGQNGLNVMTRLMGLIVATIGVGMFLTGLKAFGW